MDENEEDRLIKEHQNETAQPGSNISPVEVTNISCNGLWILVNAQEMFLPFEHFPWFQEAPIKKILHVQMPSENHRYWPDLDIDLDINSILDPLKYPLISQQNVETS